MMLGVSDEVYLIDADSMRLVNVSESAQKILAVIFQDFKQKS